MKKKIRGHNPPKAKTPKTRKQKRRAKFKEKRKLEKQAQKIAA